MLWQHGCSTWRRLQKERENHTSSHCPGDTEDEDEGPSSPRAEPVVGEAEGGGPSPSSRRRRQRAPRTVTLIYKKGDDLRQDQLCVQA